MESNDSIDLVDSEAGNRSVVVGTRKSLRAFWGRWKCWSTTFPFIHQFVFFEWSLLFLFTGPRVMKFPARAEEPAHERVVEVVVHAKEQIRIVTQAVSALKENVKTGKASTVSVCVCAGKRLGYWLCVIFRHVEMRVLQGMKAALDPNDEVQLFSEVQSSAPQTQARLNLSYFTVLYQFSYPQRTFPFSVTKQWRSIACRWKFLLRCI